MNLRFASWSAELFLHYLFSRFVLPSFFQQFVGYRRRALQHTAHTSNVFLRDWLEEDVVPALDEAHLDTWLDAKLAANPCRNHYPTSASRIGEIHDSSLQKLVA